MLREIELFWAGAWVSTWQSCPLCVTGCEECNNAHPSVCPKHGPLHPIPNRPVLTKARASLPLVLYIDRFLGGVFSKRRIPKRTQFGPVEGPLVRQTELKDCYIHLKVRGVWGGGRNLCLNLYFHGFESVPLMWSVSSSEMFFCYFISECNSEVSSLLYSKSALLSMEMQ